MHPGVRGTTSASVTPLRAVSSARRTALVSVFAAAFLIALKLSVGLATNSLGFVSEALHSGTDLVAALLTFFAIGVAVRPADRSHPWGHGKAEHLSALAECAILAIASVVIGYAAIVRLVADEPPHITTAWWAFAVLAVIVVVDVSRMVISQRAAKRHNSAALAANALHFASDLAGTLAVLIGLLLTRAGYAWADAAAALFIAVLVLIAAARMVRFNIDILMDRADQDAEDTARGAIDALGPDITLERLRVRVAGGRPFADAVIAVSPSAALAEGHAAADMVEDAVHRVLPGSDVVVHVEPGRPSEDLRERALAAALRVPGVREIHNVRVIHPSDRTEVTLHAKLPHDMPLEDAHRIADTIEATLMDEIPEIDAATTHLEPLDTALVGEQPDPAVVRDLSRAVEATVRDATGRPPSSLRFVQSEEGLVAYVALGLDPSTPLERAHRVGGMVRSRLRRELDGLDDVFIHAEPDGGAEARAQNRSVR